MSAEKRADGKVSIIISHKPTKGERVDFYQKHVKEKDRRRDYIDASNYVVLYFQNKEQIEKFLTGIGLNLEKSLIDGQFLNGLDLAEKLGIDIERIELKDLGMFQKSNIITDERILESKHYKDERKG